jgi:DNA mismatch endonuclease (patch repair protein)
LEFWQPKLEANAARDTKKIEALKALGWEVLVVWECEIADMNRLGARMIRFLEDTKR